MTPQEAKELLPILEAYANGETIQTKWHGTWADVVDTNFMEPASSYRIKPKPRLVEMTHEDLPAVFWVQKKDGDGRICIVTVIHPNGDLETESNYIRHENLRHWRWSPDRKDWQDFTKEVAE